MGNCSPISSLIWGQLPQSLNQSGSCPSPLRYGQLTSKLTMEPSNHPLKRQSSLSFTSNKPAKQPKSELRSPLQELSTNLQTPSTWKNIGGASKLPWFNPLTTRSDLQACRQNLFDKIKTPPQTPSAAFQLRTSKKIPDQLWIRNTTQYSSTSLRMSTPLLDIRHMPFPWCRLKTSFLHTTLQASQPSFVKSPREMAKTLKRRPLGWFHTFVITKCVWMQVICAGSPAGWIGCEITARAGTCACTGLTNAFGHIDQSPTRSWLTGLSMWMPVLIERLRAWEIIHRKWKPLKPNLYLFVQHLLELFSLTQNLSEYPEDWYPSSQKWSSRTCELLTQVISLTRSVSWKTFNRVLAKKTS